MSDRAARRLFVVAGEPSGDQLGADFIRQLQHASSDEQLVIDGVGGAQMASAGISSLIDISPLAVIGLVDGILAYPQVRKLVIRTVQKIIEFAPDMVVLVDSWGFTLRVAREIKIALPNCKLVKYVGPQVFATRPGRARTTARLYDHLLTIHSFDAPYFEKQGLKTTFVGNPVLSKPIKGNPNRLRQKYKLADRQVLCLLFGSRRSELLHLLEPFLAAISLLKVKYPGLVVISPLADHISTQARALAATDLRLQDIILLNESDKNDAFLASDIALACSGTVTLQLAQAKVPMVIGYRFGIVFNMILRSFFFKAKFANLINLAADEEIIPERMLEKCTGPLLAEALISLLADPDQQKLQNKKVTATIKQMRSTMGNPAKNAAAAVLDLLA